MTGDDRGFTVMEAIVSLAVLALVVISAQRSIATGTRAIRAADQQSRAVTVAKSAIAAAGSEVPLAAGVVEGRQGRYSWQTEIRDHQSADAASPSSRAGLYRIDTIVRWRDTALSPQKSFRLTTLKFKQVP